VSKLLILDSALRINYNIIDVELQVIWLLKLLIWEKINKKLGHLFVISLVLELYFLNCTDIIQSNRLSKGISCFQGQTSD